MNPDVTYKSFTKDQNQLRQNDILQVSQDKKTTEWLCRLQNKPYSSLTEKEYVLQNFRLDHQYLASTDSGQYERPVSTNINKQQFAERIDNITKGMKNRGISAKTETRLRSILTKSPILANERLVRAMKVLQERMSCSSSMDGVQESSSDTLNATNIQNNFQNMLTMTSLRPINEIGKGDDVQCVKQKMTKSQIVDMALVESIQKRQRKKLQERELSSKIKAWRKWKKQKADEAQFETLLGYTMKLLLKRWEEYLALSSEEIRKCEIQNARELNLADEVIEMLEDKDRYVWQLIDEL